MTPQLEQRLSSQARRGRIAPCRRDVVTLVRLGVHAGWSLGSSIASSGLARYASCSDYRSKQYMRVEESITIGELSRRTGVNIETIRCFERVGVLATPPRTSGGRRVYGTGHVRALGFVRRARELGFSPAEVRAILSLGGSAQASCSEVREIAAHHLERVRAKMEDLAQLESLLAATIDRCEGDGAARCAVIDLLNQHSTAQMSHRTPYSRKRSI